MAKFSLLGEVVRSALFMSVILWMETSSVPILTTVTEETTTINGRDCKLTKAGHDYAGPLSVTRSGLTCQRWDSDYPQNNNFKYSTLYPEGSASAAGNKCRNPDSTYNEGPWCYTTDPDTKWELCDVALCGSSCDGITCPSEKSCEVNSDGQPECICRTMCTADYAPVCGSNGKTYGNRCELRVAACRANKNITMAYEGQCKTDTSSVPILSPVTEETTTNNGRGSSCGGITCPSGKYCILISGGYPDCICNTTCTEEFSPVCGSDGKTYDNRCELNVAACQTNTIITVAYEGECKTETSSVPIVSTVTEETTTRGSRCDGITCSSGKYCILISNGYPDCICNTTCTEEFAPVCGSDGKTYVNRCELNVAACQTNTIITVAYEGECKTETSSVPILSTVTEETTTTNGKGSSCDGKTCPSGKSCEVNSEGHPECVCDTKCTFEYAPVCGSDGKTYTNRCLLKVAVCLGPLNVIITVAYEGKCKTDGYPV